mmetsp:Transcript_11416/g.47793  ORF Transcript_11416/g.47793 Transcript_11416/m.47793 type:complete len:219 (-) Transcript_11416:655-1311(-)
MSENATAESRPSRSSASARAKSNKNTGITRAPSPSSPSRASPRSISISSAIRDRNARSQYRNSAESRNSLCVPPAGLPTSRLSTRSPCSPSSAPAYVAPPSTPPGAGLEPGSDERAVAFRARCIAATHSEHEPTPTSVSVTRTAGVVPASSPTSSPPTSPPNRGIAAAVLSADSISPIPRGGTRRSLPRGRSVTLTIFTVVSRQTLGATARAAGGARR